MVEFATLASQEANQGRRSGLQLVEPSQLPWWHVLGCLENPSFTPLFSLMRQRLKQQVPRSEAHCMYFGRQGCPLPGGTQKGSRARGTFCRSFIASITVLAKATNSSFSRVSGHIHYIWVVNFVVFNIPLGLPLSSSGPHFISHLQINICLESSRHCRATFVSARARFVLGAVPYRGCCHGKYQCLSKL